MQLKEIQFHKLIWMFGLVLMQCFPVTMNAQQAIKWKALTDVTFTEKYDQKIDGYWLVPTFGEKTKAWNNQQVILEGFFIPIDLDENFHVLSRYPYSSCFFCGGAGPESIVELQLDKEVAKRLEMDQRLRFEGTLVLNDSDMYHCSYILKNARPVKNQK